MLTCRSSGWIQSASSTSGLAPRVRERPPYRAISRAAISLSRSQMLLVLDLHLRHHVNRHGVLPYLWFRPESRAGL
jgi:hypothetical protein